MEDIYDHDSSLTETVATGIILHEAYKNTPLSNPDHIDHTEEWNKLKKRGRNGILACLVRINTYFYILALLLALAYCFVTQVLGIAF